MRCAPLGIHGSLHPSQLVAIGVDFSVHGNQPGGCCTLATDLRPSLPTRTCDGNEFLGFSKKKIRIRCVQSWVFFPKPCRARVYTYQARLKPSRLTVCFRARDPPRPSKYPRVDLFQVPSQVHGPDPDMLRQLSEVTEVASIPNGSFPQARLSAYWEPARRSF